MTKTRAFLLGLIAIVAIVGIAISLNQNKNQIEKSTPTAIGVSHVTSSPSAPILAAPSVYEGDFFVSPAGDNSNPGSETKPWRSIQFAVDHTQPGKKILLMPGTYNEGVHILKAGNANNPITLTSTKDGGVIIDGGPEPAINGEADYWIIKGLQLTSKADRTIKVASSYWKIQKNKVTGAVYFWGNNNLLEENDIDGSQHLGNENGVMDDGPSSHHNIFRGNKVHDFKLRGFWSQWLTHDDIFESNEIFNITDEAGMGIDLDAASNVGYRHTIRGNIIHDCAQTGIELENSYEALVENNIIYNTGLEGIQVINYKGCIAAGENNQYGQADGNCEGDDLGTVVRQNLIFNGGRVGGVVSYHSSGVKMYNNTIYGSGAGLYILGDASLAGKWDVQGNILAGNTRVQISVDDPKSLSVDKYNLVYQPDSGNAYEIRGSASKFFTLADWQQQFGLGQDSIQANPMFLNPSLNDFRLAANSPAIDKGVNLQITSDLEKRPRPSGPNFDMGAYEK
jgi:parallel beta-helix repeat protein